MCNQTGFLGASVRSWVLSPRSREALRKQPRTQDGCDARAEPAASSGAAQPAARPTGGHRYVVLLSSARLANLHLDVAFLTPSGENANETRSLDFPVLSKPELRECPF